MTKTIPDNAVLAAWQRTLALRQDAAAIRANDGRIVRSFSDIEAEAKGRLGLLAGLPQGSVVGVQIGNSASWPALVLALFRAGLVPLPLGRHMDQAELDLALATCGASALITTDGEQLTLTGDRLADSAPAWDTPVPDFLKLTFGIGSAPRAIRFRAEQLAADCENICNAMGLTDADLNFGVIPFSHSYGFSNLVLPLLCWGVPLVASDDRMPRAILGDLARTGATVFPGMPVFFHKFAEMGNLPELPALRLCISAGALLTREVAERFTARCGQKIHNFYGASECGGIAYDAAAATECEEGFLGEPIVGVEVTRSGADPGLIEVRGAAVGDGYFPVPDAASLAQGRFIPTDLIRWKRRGMIITGRISDIINVAGRKLNPREVEQRLRECRGVREAVVFGVPSALRGEEPVACVVPEDGTDAAQVLRFCHAALSPWQVPKSIWLVPAIPSDAQGNVSRRALADRFRSEQRDA